MKREYAIALQHVQVKYRDLYAQAEAVVLTPARMFPPCQEGQCSRDNYININDALTTVGAYVNVLVHELTHAAQNKRGGPRLTDLQREEEAYAAGNLAATEYMREAAPWNRK